MSDFHQRSRRERSVYLLPSLLTTSAMFSGFYGIISAINGQFVIASIAVIVAMLFDGLDGRVARLTKTQSAFGAEYDSLADMVSFGLAPALIAFLWALESMGKFGWIAAFIFVAGAALRLARFNTQVNNEEQDKRFFYGLASPPAAGLVVTLVWNASLRGWQAEWLVLLFAVVVTVCGVLMVSNIRYYNFKTMGGRKRVPFVVLPLLVLVFGVIALQPPLMLMLMAITYAISGPILEVVLRVKARSAVVPPVVSDQDEC